MATEDPARGAGPDHTGVEARSRPLPDRDTCERVLAKMMLIRRFEERAGEMYAKAKIGGFLHLCIGEEATIVGATQALREGDYLLSTYREHGQALARGTEPEAVMAELFGKVGGCSGGHGGSMHLFDAKRRFLGGYGIVGGNLPLAAGVALACDYRETDDTTLCMLGDGATNQGTFGETMNLAALWKLPIVFMVINNQFGMGTALERHSAETDLSKKAAGFGVPGVRCDGMDVLDTHACVTEALERARSDRAPQLVEAVTYRYRGHSMADPEEYRTKEEVEQWRERDPIATFSKRATAEGDLTEADLERLDSEATQAVDAAVEFAESSPFPELASMYDDIYVMGDQVGESWFSVDRRSPEPHRGEREREAGDVARELAEAGAAHASGEDARSDRRVDRAEEPGAAADGAPGDGEGEPAGEDRDRAGGGD